MAETTERVLQQTGAARSAAAVLARSSQADRDRGLRAYAGTLSAQRREILAANAADLAAADSAAGGAPLATALRQRLKLDAAKLDELIAGLEAVQAMPDPLGRETLATQLDDGLILRRLTCPIGVVGVIFESRPDALVQIAGLALKSGNALVLKGGSEAEFSNRALHAALASALTATGFPVGALALIETRAEVAALLQATAHVDLLIPRGSNALVRAIQHGTTIPILGHAEGICHVYVDQAANLEQALRIACDSKTQYPAACNAAETLLVHRAVAGRFVPGLVSALGAAGVEVRADQAARAFAGEELRLASDADFATEHGDLVVSLRVVEDLDQALAHIARFGSRHTEAIVTEHAAAWERFRSEVDAAGVFRNASTRFADGYRYGFGAEVGIATGKLHPRGPVGIEGLVTYKYVLEGEGHVVADYSGPAARRFQHRSLPLQDG
jgi:glutamate-5-semialdehyde dehydrogenase